MSAQAKQTAPRVLTCERCGTDLTCMAGTGQPCWCRNEGFALPMPLPDGVGPYADCLCADCLRTTAEELRALGHGPTSEPDK
ncbi:MAG: cysteine-rich CWC family protein [Pseudomonadota bacterium]